jgi:hypothetical protein
LVGWFIRSFVRSFVLWFFGWFGDSLVRSFVLLLVGSIFGFLVGSFVGSLIGWIFGCSVVRLVNLELCPSAGIQTLLLRPTHDSIPTLVKAVVKSIRG